MSKKEQLYFSLERILEGRPSILRNSTLVLFFRVLSWVLMISSFLLIFLYDLAFETVKPVIDRFEEGSIPWVSIGFLTAFVIFYLMLRLTKMIHKRNAYLLDIELWIEEYKADARKEDAPSIRDMP